MQYAIDVATKYANVRELSPNRSPDIDRWNERCHAPLGSNWCASFVTNCVLECAEYQGLGFDFVLTASSQAIKRWAVKAGRLITDPNELLEVSGALFGWTNKGGIHGHVGFVTKRYSNVLRSGKRVVSAIQTLEGNTSPSGSRLGHGVYAIRRGTPVDGSRKLWFVDMSGLTGCDWWPLD